MLNRCLVSLAVCSGLLPTGLRAQRRPPPACDEFRAVLQADPNNLDAAASLGQCTLRDESMIAPGGDSSRLAFRSSWTSALLALRRVVELDPSYTRAYRPLFAILFAETRDGCSYETGICSHVASVVRDGDSVITTPRLVRPNGMDSYHEATRESRAKGQANIVEARTLAERWAAVAPNDYRPHEYLGRALLRLGDPAAAVRELERAASLADAAARRNLFWERLEALVKSGQGDDARRVLDEAVSDPARDTSQLRSYTVADLNALLGRNRPAPVDSAVLRRNQARFDSIMRTNPPPPLRAGFSRLLATGDTAAARRELARTDSMAVPPDRMTRIPRFDHMHFESARQHLALGDTAIAEARITEIEQAFNDAPFRYLSVYVRPGSWLGPVWILSGDLAAARHRFADAARTYRRVIGLWGGADPGIQPLVAEARAKLESLPKG